MTDQTRIVVVEADRLERIEAQIEGLMTLMRASHIKPAPEWLTRQDAAEALGVTARTLDRMAQDGRVEAKGAGKGRRFRI